MARREGRWIRRTFWFGFDVTRSWMMGTENMLIAMTGEPELVENGGFIFSSDHSIPNSVSLENMRRIAEEMKRVGRY